MKQTASDRTYELDRQQNADVIALAQRRNEPPQKLVSDAVARYLKEAEYETLRAAAFAKLRHPERDHSVFASWRGADIDGVQYQNELRSE